MADHVQTVAVRTVIIIVVVLADKIVFKAKLPVELLGLLVFDPHFQGDRFKVSRLGQV